jgi:hypothetical protein
MLKLPLSCAISAEPAAFVLPTATFLKPASLLHQVVLARSARCQAPRVVIAMEHGMAAQEEEKRQESRETLGLLTADIEQALVLHAARYDITCLMSPHHFHASMRKYLRA